ncbi:alpha/beta fold hydrolase [Sinomicrobium weinanense]|uniref:Proline iminopeptidase n=1 Tax=Sinomicrobium weinanense TaxID=2842200 RepID=A0A926JRL8_9FLAO|nr:alpha/beta hydrolase [Sinomicrobium weinanense]MBC9795966.1 alpha/beta hydrolase [Sinomicrobium weinanense]MBU3122085.1 alpha/beta hydrolase [Sinomicrobium weinanense]
MRIKEQKFHLSFLLFITPLFFLACQKETKMDTELFIPVEKSRLYVRLVGNADKPLIINLHGGPGAFSGFEHEFNRKHLEDDYLIAYLDQRGGGKSDVCTDSTMLTMQQFVKDLDVVVDSLQSKFKDKSINLIGSSWGGTLGLLYMIEHQDKINSFACVSGKADGVYPIKALIQREQQLARELIENSKDSAAKNQYRKILTKLKEIDESDLGQFFDDMNLLKHKFPEELGFNAYWANPKAKEIAVELGKDSAYYARARYTKTEFGEAMEKYELVNRVFRNTPSYNHLNIIDEIAVITKPVLVLQGESDYAIGVEQANMIYKHLKSVPEGKKELKIIPNAAHNLNLEAEELYFDTVKSFFGKYSD